MASLLRRAWSSVRQTSKEAVGKSQSEDMAMEDDGPEVMKLPGEMLFSIFARLDSVDLAHVSAVCKTWHAIADDDALWEARLVADNGPLWPSVQFAENFLRAGFCQRPASDVPTGHRSRLPGTALPSPTLNALLPFRSIYSQRAMVPRAIIFDGGSGYAKYGWSDEVAPQDTLATFLEFGNIESPLYPRLKHLFTVIFDRMRVKASAQPIVLSTPTVHSDDSQIEKKARRQLRETTFSVLFELGVPAICAIDQAVLALFASNQTSGIVVNIGFHVTTVAPVLHGVVMRSLGLEIMGQGAMTLTVHLSELMHQSGLRFASMYTARTLKEKLCYVAQDFVEEHYNENCEASCEVGTEGTFTLRSERFRAPEILFQPRLGNLRTMALHQAVALCIDHCYNLPLEDAADANWYKNIVLTGGSACLPGLSGRLEKELSRMLPADMSDGIRVLPPKQGPYSAWFGAKVLSNVSTFQSAWCVTRKQFKRLGPSCVHDHDIYDDDMVETQSIREQAWTMERPGPPAPYR
ncbi:hypothetical protein KC19_2G282100 [Ceratodon purpureus]|uniref:F-box domain-containing protein n=1 Tax=Ceratodon purpureus TaxID=3225 RepID=A0A8T0IZ30_CERPU|nr:hypothetical protein KC19_2G282100 [Ceratodon purpureus]